MPIWQTLASRLSTSDSKNPRVRAHIAGFNKLRSIPGGLTSVRTTTEQIGTFNRKGITDAVHQYAAKHVAADLRREMIRHNEAAKKLADRRRALTIPAIDKSDIVGALLRQEMRSVIRSFDPAKKAATFSVDPDPVVVAAVFEAPEFLTGVSGEFRSRIEREYAEKHYPNEIAELQQEAEVLEVVGMGLETCIKEVRTEMGISEHEFKKWLVTSTPEIDREIIAASGREFPPDVDVVVEMVKSLPDWKSRERVSNALIESL